MQIIIVGGGKTGSHLAARLTDDGAAVTVIENRPEAAKRVRTACPAATVIEGSGADPRGLERAGVHRVDAVAAVTGEDEVNLVVSLLAKMEFSVPRVVARVNSPANAWMFTPANGVDVGVNQAEITARFIMEGMNARDVYTLMRLGRDDHRIVQATVAPGARVAGRALRDIAFPAETIVVGIDHEGTLAGHRLLTQSVKHPHTKHHSGGDVHVITQICFHFLLSLKCYHEYFYPDAKLSPIQQTANTIFTDVCIAITEVA